MVLRHLCCLGVFASLLLTTGCVPNKIYRPKDQAIESAPTMVGNPEPGRFKLGILEFDDMGEFWEKCPGLKDANTCQLTRILNLIQQEKAGGHEVAVVVFIHGWKNNASQANELRPAKNLDAFKETLQLLARAEQTRADKSKGSAKPFQPKTIIGIYMAWRGQVVPGDVFLTFWNRRDAAQRVGSSDFAEALFRIMATTKEESSKSRVIVVGHSFGGRALETAITNSFVSSLVPQPGEDGKIGPIYRTSPADLILYVNPATDSFRTKEMIELMKRTSFSITRGDHPPGPLFLSVTSVGDSATGVAFPLGQGLSATRKSFRPGYDEAPRSPAQKEFFTHTPGHMPYLYSHTVTQVDLKPDSCSPDGTAFRFSASTKCYEMKPISQAFNDSPFWVTTVPTTIIPNHSDIFKAGFADMVSKLVEYYGVFDSNEPAIMNGVAK